MNYDSDVPVDVTERDVEKRTVGTDAKRVG